VDFIESKEKIYTFYYLCNILDFKNFWMTIDFDKWELKKIFFDIIKAWIFLKDNKIYIPYLTG